MTTSAGRLSSRISQGPPSRSASRTRPIRYPIAAPSVIASVKASVTRANVTPRWKNKSPDLASAIMVVSTVGGGGSFASPANSEPTHQVARRTANDSRRGTSASRDRVIECPGIEFRRRPDKFAAADPSQHAVENARVGFFVRDRATRNALPIAIAIGAQRGGVGSTGQWRNFLPLGIRARQDIFCRAGHGDEAGNLVLVCVCPFFVEDVADHRGAAFGAEFRQQILNAGDTAEALRFQGSAEIPVVQGRIHFPA